MKLPHASGTSSPLSCAVSSEPWARYLRASVVPAHGRSSIGALVEIETSHGSIVLGDTPMADAHVPTFSPSEVWILSSATGGETVSNDILRAILEAKRVLGGNVVAARRLDA